MGYSSANHFPRSRYSGADADADAGPISELTLTLPPLIPERRITLVFPVVGSVLAFPKHSPYSLPCEDRVPRSLSSVGELMLG